MTGLAGRGGPGRARLAGVVAGALNLGAIAGGAQDWPQFARDAARTSHIGGPVAPLSPRWLFAAAGGEGVSFAGQSGAVVAAGRVVAIGRIAGQPVCVCYSALSGALIWSAPIPAVFLDSWSTPAVDAPSGVAYVASGRCITALDLASGAVRFQTELARQVVNASPCLTSDRGPADRLFITDYDGFGGQARLYCINIDPFDAGANPFQPGEIVWSAAIGGSSGNSPAYAGGVVFTGSITDESASTGGRVLAFAAGAVQTPSPLWSYTLQSAQGFFGGVSVADGAVFAATYWLYGGQLNSTLVKLDAGSGALIWATACGRTDSTPVPLPGGRIALSVGIAGFGSAPAIQLLQDQGSSASLLWDSALATWDDVNTNGIIEEGEYLRIGGWTVQPAAIVTPGQPARLVTGAIPAAGGPFGACNDLYILDLSRQPGESGFVVDHAVGAGNSPAAAAGLLVSIGQSGLHVFDSCSANCDGSTVAPALNILDFSCFLGAFAAGAPYANCDGSTAAPVLNVLDFSCFLNRFAGGCP
jgi:outer membrane protein assembly factor BamB